MLLCLLQFLAKLTDDMKLQGCVFREPRAQCGHRRLKGVEFTIRGSAIASGLRHRGGRGTHQFSEARNHSQVMHPDLESVILPSGSAQLLGRELTVYGEGFQTRSFCYADDLIDGLVRQMATPRT